MGTSMAAADAIMGVVGSQTAASLMSGRRSKKLGAGMATMVSMTKKKARQMSGTKMPTRRTNGSSSTLLAERQFMPTVMDSRITALTRPKRGGGGGRNRRVNWSSSGLPRVYSKPSTMSGRKRRMSAAAKDKVCRPKMGKDGTLYQTVMKTGTYQTGKRQGRPYSRCVKAGGQSAKDAMGIRGCPVGQVLKTYTTRVPVSRRKGDTRMKTVQAQRCIKAVGAIKNCPSNQVIVQYRQTGRVGPAGQKRSYDTLAKKCVLPATAAKRGYVVLGAGTLPVRSVPRKPAAPRRPRVAMSMGM